jgi:hypothetical protein
MATAEQHWSEVASAGSGHLEESLTKALTRSLDVHRKNLLAAEEAAATEARKHWGGVQQALESCAAGSKSEIEALAEQAKDLVRVVEATGHVRSLEESLNRNMAALATSQHLQETLINLTAAVSLLNARLERFAPTAAHLTLHAGSASKAA